jgi:hypothetical protein
MTYYGEPPEDGGGQLLSSRHHTTRRAGVKCDAGKHEMPVGTEYMKDVYIWDGDFNVYKECRTCFDKREYN